MRKYDKIGRKYLAQLCNGKGLDVGCGELKIAENCIGVDLRTDAGADRVADMRCLPWNDEQFDFVVSSHALEHTHFPIDVLKEWRRVLRVGGVVGVVVPHGEHVQPSTLGHSSGGHYQLFTPRTLEIMLEHCGFTKVKSLEYARPYAWRETPAIFATGTK